MNLEQKGSKFVIKRAVRQGDTLSPNLFNCILEEVFRGLH